MTEQESWEPLAIFQSGNWVLCRRNHPKKKRGPKTHTTRAEGVDWKDALKHAMGKPKPKKWPKKP